MGSVCLGQGGTVLPAGFLEGLFGDAYLDWSKEYPGSQQPPPPPPQPHGEPPEASDVPPDTTNMDLWAASILANAWRLATRETIDPTTLMVLQSLSRSETFYGWPLFPLGKIGTRDATRWWGHHNWAASVCYTVLGGRPVACYQNGGCVSGFLDMAKRKTQSGWVRIPVCYEHYKTNLAGAEGYVRRVLSVGDEQAVKKVLRSGRAFDVAAMLRAAGMLIRTDNASEKAIVDDAAYFASRMMRSARTISINTALPMVMTEGLPQGVSVAYDPSEPAGLTDRPAAAAPVLSPAQAIAGVAIGVSMGVAGTWLYRKIKG